MKELTSSGLICVKDEFNIEYHLCKIDYILKENETFKYIFTPYYDVIDLLGTNVFQGIPGLELELRKEEYIRENIVPVFISERVPQENRVDYNEILESLNMDYLDPILYLIKCNKKYSGDNLYVIDYIERKNVVLSENNKENQIEIIKNILNNIAFGNDVILNDKIISSKEVFDSLLFIYSKNYEIRKERQQRGIEEAKKLGKYKGRKPIHVDKLLFMEQLEKVNKGLITSKDAANNLGISIDKYYRYKKMQN